MEKRNYSLTNYPNIYKNTYWGNFIKREDTDINSIIENRNKFITDFDIKSIQKNLPEYIYKALWKLLIEKNLDLKLIRDKWRCSDLINNYCTFFDHKETYKTKSGNFIIVFSPYNELDGEKIEELGFERIYNLYHKDAFTYVKQFSKK